MLRTRIRPDAINAGMAKNAAINYHSALKQAALVNEGLADIKGQGQDIFCTGTVPELTGYCKSEGLAPAAVLDQAAETDNTLEDYSKTERSYFRNFGLGAACGVAMALLPGALAIAAGVGGAICVGKGLLSVKRNEKCAEALATQYGNPRSAVDSLNILGRVVEHNSATQSANQVNGYNIVS